MAAHQATYGVAIAEPKTRGCPEDPAVAEAPFATWLAAVRRLQSGVHSVEIHLEGRALPLSGATERGASGCVE